MNVQNVLLENAGGSLIVRSSQLSRCRCRRFRHSSISALRRACLSSDTDRGYRQCSLRTSDVDVPDGSSKRKDVKLAASIVDQATSGKPTADPDEGKNPAAVELGRLGGEKGGQARAEKLSPDAQGHCQEGSRSALGEEGLGALALGDQSLRVESQARLRRRERICTAAV